MKLDKWLLLFLTISLSTGISVTAAMPYQNYTYDIHGEPNAEPQAYIPKEIISGTKMGITSLKNPSDLVMGENQILYISDSGNNRIILLDSEYKVKRILDHFELDGKAETFNNPTGLFITKENDLYIADTDNGRVVVLRPDYSCKKILTAPVKGEAKLDYAYTPICVAVDFAERVYVVSKNCSEGIIQFDKKGDFLGYFGAIKTNPNLSYLFWKSIATEEQKKSMELVVPTEYSGIDIDERGFVYGTVSAIDSTHYRTDMFVHRLNPLGVDVLKRNGFKDPMGDVKVEIDKDKDTLNISRLTDVVVQKYGFYTVLDSNKGRVFTYNRNGDFLYVFGAMGTDKGQFGNPVALEEDGNGKYYVLDEKYNQIVTFEPTEYAQIIREAFIANYNRDYVKSEKLWFQALRYTSKSDLVFNEIGKLYIEQGNYAKAMEYLKLSSDRVNYSEAYRYYRENLLSHYFGVGMTVIIVIIALFITIRITLKRRGKEHV